METGAVINPSPIENQQTLWVGKDHLTISESLVLLDAAKEIPDWQVRDFQRIPIFVGDFKFFLRQKLAAEKPFVARYVLERWPADANFSAAPISFTYDEQFVLDRDAEHSCNARFENLGRALICFYPLLGFLWANTKKKLIPAGFIPRSITGVSVFTCFCLLLLQGTFIRMRVGLFTFLFGDVTRLNFAWLAADYALFGLMFLDIILRFDQHIRHTTDNPWGFCEWMSAPFRRKPVDEEEVC